MNKKNITIGIIGPTNSGKSTLLNNIIGEKLAIVTHKSQTTRSAFKGIKNFTKIGRTNFIDR